VFVRPVLTMDQACAARKLDHARLNSPLQLRRRGGIMEGCRYG
jgi:hypothetical protein